MNLSPGRGSCWRRCLRGAATAIALTLIAVAAAAQEEPPPETSGQLWANLVVGHSKSARLYYELDLEPKTQVSGGAPWYNLDATPLVEFYPHSLVDLTGEMTVGYTRQNAEENSFELTPRLGIRLHLFKNVWNQIRPERVPLSRFSLANLSRIEFRNFWYTGDRLSSHETRFRNRTEFKLAINHDRLAEDRTVYLLFDVEFFVPLSDDVPERFATKQRFRSGFGYRRSHRWQFEVLYIRDFARETLDQEGNVDLNALDVRLKLFP